MKETSGVFAEMGRAVPIAASLEQDAEKEMAGWLMPGVSFPIDGFHNRQPTPHTWGQDATAPLLPNCLGGKSVNNHYFQKNF